MIALLVTEDAWYVVLRMTWIDRIIVIFEPLVICDQIAMISRKSSQYVEPTTTPCTSSEEITIETIVSNI